MSENKLTLEVIDTEDIRVNVTVEPKHLKTETNSS